MSEKEHAAIIKQADSRDGMGPRGWDGMGELATERPIWMARCLCGWPPFVDNAYATREGARRAYREHRLRDSQ